MPERPSILVVGGGNLERAADGSWATKVPIAAYLDELADHFGGCVWIAQAYGTWGDDRGQGTSGVAGHLDPAKIRAIPFAGRLSRAPQNCLLMLRQLRGCDFAVFFLPAALTMIPALPLARLFTRRIAVYVAGDFAAPLADEGSVRGRLWGSFYRATFRAAIRMAGVVIARGRYLADISRRLNRRVVETVPLGHMQPGELPPAVEPTPDAPRRILYMGLILESKGVGDLLHVMKILGDRRPSPSIQLDLLGDGPDRARFEALAGEFAVSLRVRFHGWVEDADRVNAFLSNAHVVVMPSSTHAEGVPRVIDEALVRGVPVVATRIAGMPEEFRDGEVLLVDPGAPHQLADAVEQILFEPDVRRRYLDGAMRRREHWQGCASAADQHARILRGDSDGDRAERC
ncbi:MAG: glycosyltransferase [Myxococcota bacterium]